MVPPEHFLLVQAQSPFRVAITENKRTLKIEESLPDAEGQWFALFTPAIATRKHRPRTLKLTLFDGKRTRHADGPLLYLAHPATLRIKGTYHRPELLRRSFMFLATNGRGAMMRAAVSWGELGSRYDALLAANLDPRYPENRYILFTRCRAWLVYQGYSSEIGNDCIKTFSIDPSKKGVWQFEVPSGQGESVFLTVTAEMIEDRNAIGLTFLRRGTETSSGGLADHRPVQLILRPDIESRDFHDTTKAYLGPEQRWPQAIQTHADGFVFSPATHLKLAVTLPGSRFVPEPEWHYMIQRPLDGTRGLDSDSDLFSPGYFSIFLNGNQKAVLSAAVVNAAASEDHSAPAAEALPADRLNPEGALERALDHYVVRRGPLKSVIAGYPWFLDWGRDALIFVRGLIAAGRLQDARRILQQFGQFEQGGTLPNMIQGQDAGNRDTSDAPLWFFIACKELITAEGSQAFLDEIWGERTLRKILGDMGAALIEGTATGIRLDPDSGLLYSPSHFTWMDTNYPAGTPREGYPIEIQALWYAAQLFLSQIAADSDAARWQSSAPKTKDAIRSYFYLNSKGYMSDCLHAGHGVPAARAQADDALRPNQLFALTLDAVDNPEIARSILAACEELLIPGAIRSLSNRRLDHPLPIVYRGKRVNDPHRPYWGKYAGDEDTRRKPAYHNGTAWTWIFPSYCEAWWKVYGANARETALAWLGSGCRLIERGCIGHLPEILDGDYPHLMRGCDAQAWGVSEMLRVWKMLNKG
jgi:predicted glycogen debranching enzyme